MALRVQVLRKKAQRFEAKQLLVHEIDREKLSSLEPMLQEVVSVMRPKPNDYEVRRALVHAFNDISKEIYGNSQKSPVVVEFGSFVMDLFLSTSDLDLSVNFNSNEVEMPREKKIQILRNFSKKLYSLQSKGHVYGVFPITTAKVPIVKVFDRGTGVECDISVENWDGILKSKIIPIISQIDGRFHKLSFLMKIWAKAHNINSSRNKTLNSLSIILLVAFHLQTRNPPILPPFSAIFKDGTDPATVLKSVTSFVGFGKNNNESLAELFVTLLIKLHSVENLWRKGICASTCDASWISRTWDSKVACFSVEDFTDRSQNVARAVGPTELKRINKCIEISIGHVFSFLDGQFGALTLKELCFGMNNIPISLPNNPSNSLQFAERNSSQSDKSSGLKKRKLQTKTSYVNKKATIWNGTYAKTQQHKARSQIGPQKVEDTSWGSSQLSLAGSYVGSPVPAAGVWRAVQPPPPPIPGGMGITQQHIDRGLGGCMQPIAGNWERIQQPSTISSVEVMQTASINREAAPQQPLMRPWGGVPYYLWTNPNFRTF